MRKAYLEKLIINESEPVVWVMTAQPSIAGTPWRKVDSAPDRITYEATFGVCSFGGMIDAKGERWLVLTAYFKRPVTLVVAHQLRKLFFKGCKEVMLFMDEECPADEVMIASNIDSKFFAGAKCST